MSKIAIYRKHRPTNFSDVIGQEHVVRTITNALSEDRISHAYLFIGPRGTGKTTIGRLVAKAVNCEDKKGFEPCNKCSSCLEIKEGHSMDLIEIDAASNRGIDDIRNLKEGINFVPTKSPYKIFIIDEAHQLTKEASNALLKTLEEPPEHAIFILATTEAHKMLPTIISRCQTFNFKKLTIEEIEKRLTTILKKEELEFEEEGIRLIALASGGGVRDAESMLDQVISFCGWDKKIETKEVEKVLGLANKEIVIKLLEIITEKNTKEAIEYLNNSLFEGVSVEELLKSLIYYTRELLFLKIDYLPSNSLIRVFTKEEKERMKELYNTYSEEELKNILNKFQEAESKIRYSSITELPLEVVIVEICQEKV